MTVQSRDMALLETIRQGLFWASVHDTNATLGDRSTYIGLSELSKYGECPRAAVLSKLRQPGESMTTLLATQRGHWFENGVKSALEAGHLDHIHQLEITLTRRTGSVKAHLDFTLVWDEPVKAIRILEVKSTERLPEEPWETHVRQARGQVTLLRHCWNKPVFSLRKDGALLYENISFPNLCRECFDMEMPIRPSGVSIESWLLYLSMKGAKAFGPYIHSSAVLTEIMEQADAFHQDLRKCVGNTPPELSWHKGYYPLCACCDVNADCPKFTQGSYQPQWEPALCKLEELKKRQTEITGEVKEIEDALKQAHALMGTKDWIDTGGHRFRMSMVSGRKSLDQDALKTEIADILHGFGSEIDVEALFTACMKQGNSFPRLTISPINQ